MSAINSPLTREPVEIDGRAMTPPRRARILARDGRQCRYPDCASTDRLEVDHIICLELGGKDSDSNLQTLCYDHHKQKTARDVRLIAKAKRQHAKLRLDREPPKTKAPLRSRGFRSTRPMPEVDLG